MGAIGAAIPAICCFTSPLVVRFGVPGLSDLVGVLDAGCGALLKPASGDCCVFCFYGSVPCPPVQETRVGRPATCGGAGDRR